ncbi:pseudouridine synthase [Loigolactobacillus backii]|uniref:Pseudouridine synthase n=1 Tax=Loigolactobacillus backii TaxID=375175 RepID=A0A192H3M2_9LACO|nr:pseudouridine synthase [Loigolactobacillus backii]ANK59576.1 pseudouridine synthase [Loigolactobacillus backii]ANK62858.1 pseudouridine synthase [Loigolactobacillus backii]ANK64570.1 pseudouridine synthase [Loigolactobacillus backii]ANK67035.1 pseudouridine synthase [Loigolactobacillus backii]ANK70134.1 pseudouridine synthase [Loigolactobacillus backii]
MERLQKVIAAAGVASRRKAETLISDGRVTVNGETVTEMGVKVSDRDQIEVNGVPLEQEKKRYFLFYKPRQVISAASDDKKRKTVVDFFPEVNERIYPIGRLDYNTSGLIILTNDGELANLLTHPRYQIEKSYIAKVTGIPTSEAQKTLRTGVRLEKRRTAAAKIKLLSSDKVHRTAQISVTIHEGMNHEVRDMLTAVGYPVEKLRRERYAFLTADGLVSGDSRPLQAQEVAALKKLARTGKIH